MLTSKASKPAFQSVEIDLIDQRLDAQAAEKGIPTLVVPKLGPPEAVDELNVLQQQKVRREKRAGGQGHQFSARRAAG